MNNNKTFFFILVILNLTVGANDWTFFGIHIGQTLYYILFFFCVLVNIKNKYLQSTVSFLLIAFIFKFLSLLNGNAIFMNLGDLFSALIFLISGNLIFGNNLYVLYKYFLIFIAISIPVMLIQKVGLHTFFYAWNTELFHPNNIYSFDEVKDFGKIFKDIPLFPTLFVKSESLISGMYQSRPTGLLYSNNILSSFICILLSLHFSIEKKFIPKISYFIVSFSAVLSGSFLVFIIYILLSIYFLVKSKYFSKKSIISIRFLLLSLVINYILFPGLVSNAFSESFVWIKLSSRFIEIFNVLGYNGSRVFYDLSSGLIPLNYNTDLESSSSILLNLFKIQFLIPFLLLSFFIFKFYKKKLVLIKVKLLQINLNSYNILFLTLLAILFVVPVLKAPFFHITLGASLYPLLTNFSNKNTRKIINKNLIY